MPPTEHLWAPWRMDYILSDKPPGCVLCLPEEVDPKESLTKGLKALLKARLVLHVGAHASVIMNLYPYNNGHLLVSPKRHTPDIESLSDAESIEFFNLIKSSAKILKEALKPEGINIGMNLGKSAGAGIDDHLHMHLVPRWAGDTNFMPVLTDTRVTPEHLHATYDRLRPSFDMLLSK